MAPSYFLLCSNGRQIPLFLAHEGSGSSDGIFLTVGASSGLEIQVRATTGSAIVVDNCGVSISTSPITSGPPSAARNAVDTTHPAAVTHPGVAQADTIPQKIKGKIYCWYWIKNNRCAYLAQTGRCRYQHVMPPFEAWEEAGHLVPKHLYEYYNLDRRGKPRGTKARGRAPIEVIPFTPGPDTVSPAIHQPGPSGSPSGQQHGLNGSSSVNGLYQKPDTGIDNTHAQKQASEDVLVASSHATSGHQIIKPGYIVGDHVTSGTERHIGVLTATLNNSTDLIDIGITAAQAPVTVPTVTECPTNKHVVNSHLCRVTCLGMAPAYITLASGASGNSPVVAVHTPELVQPDANRSATPTEIPPPVDDLLRREHIAAQNLAIPIVGDGGSSAIVGSLEEAPVSPATTAPVNAGLVNTAATPGSSLLSVIDPNDPISLELVQLLLKFRLSQQTGSQGA